MEIIKFEKYSSRRIIKWNFANLRKRQRNFCWLTIADWGNFEFDEKFAWWKRFLIVYDLESENIEKSTILEFEGDFSEK